MKYIMSLFVAALLIFVTTPVYSGNVTLLKQGTEVFSTTTNNDTLLIEIPLTDVDWTIPMVTSYAYLDGDTLGGAANTPTIHIDTTANFTFVSTFDTTGMNYTGVTGSTTRGAALASNGDSISVEYALLEDGSTFGTGGSTNYYGTWHMAARTLKSDRSTTGVNIANFTGLKVMNPAAKLAIRVIFYPDSVLTTTGNSSGLEFEYRVYGKR